MSLRFDGQNGSARFLSLPRMVRAYCLTGVLLLMGTACTIGAGLYGPMKLEVPFWEQQRRPMGIVLFGAPEGSIYRDGGNAFLPTIVADIRDDELIKLLASTRPDYEWLVDRYAALFASRGYAVLSLEDRDLQLGKRYPGSTAEDPNPYYWFDFPPYRIAPARNGDRRADLLLVIQPGYWGVTRQYAGFIPVSRHYATFNICVELYDLPNKVLLWRRYSTEAVGIPLHWSEPPDHPKVREALDQALQKSGNDSLSHFEAWDGTRAELVYVPKHRVGGGSTAR